MFGLIILAIAVTASSMMTMRLIGPYHVSFFYKILLAGGLFLMWSAPFLAFARGRNWHGVWFNLYTYGLYFLFVWVFLLFSFLLIRDIIWIGSYWVFPSLSKHFPLFNPFNLTALLGANILSIGLTFLLAVLALYNGTKVPDVKYIQLKSDKIKSEKTIAVLSDLHLNRALSFQKLHSIVDNTNTLKPDVIVLPGDIVDDDIDLIQPHLAILKQLQAPLGIFASYGNHEFYVGLQQSAEAFHQADLTNLTMNGISAAPDLFIGGIPDDKSYERFTNKRINLSKTFQQAKANQYRILLSHNPPFVKRIQPDEIDLQISGHTHGGQIFPFHILVWLGNGFLSGLYDKTPAPLYITKGAGQWGPQMRLGADSEITLLTLTPQ